MLIKAQRMRLRGFPQVYYDQGSISPPYNFCIKIYVSQMKELIRSFEISPGSSLWTNIHQDIALGTCCGGGGSPDTTKRNEG